MHSVPGARAAARLVLACAVLAVAGPRRPLRAQSTRKVRVVGRILDAATGQPLFGADVAFGKDGPEVLTDTAGRFALEVDPGTYPLQVSQLGYRDRLRIVDIPPGARSASIDVRLAPDPVVLKGITAIADRFRQRRDAVATSVRTFERRALLATTDADAVRFLQDRATLNRTTCGLGTGGDPFGDCAWVRGRVQRIAVFIDDAPAVGGLNQLAMYDPSDLYLIEVYGGGAQVRAYTTWWVDYSARHGIRPEPILMPGLVYD